MSETFMNWQELAAAHRKLKADHEALRELVDKMADAIENHIHGLDRMYAVTKKPLKQPLSTPQPTPSPTSGQTQEPGAPAGGAR